MKKVALILMVFALALSACQQPEIKTVDLKAEEAAITAMLNKLNSAFNEQKVDTLVTLLADDSFFCGSDPAEFWNKEEITAIWTEMLGQPFELKGMGKYIIKVAPDGLSATAIQQYYMPAFSDKLAFRNGYHLIKVNGIWKIFASNTACIPKNEDLPAINEALGE